MTSLDHLPLPLTRRRLLGLTLASVAAVRPGMVDDVVAQATGSLTFLVLGLDTREENADQRSDTIMVARVDLATNTVRTLSIPRDLYLEIPGYGYDKINAAYQFGLASSPELDWEVAAGLTARTIDYNFGVGIDGTAMTDMNRFPAIIDAVGGVDVDNPYAVDDPSWPEASFPAGPIHLDGDQALVFTRTRKMDGDGGRVMRQHLVLQSLLTELQTPETFARLPDLVASLGDAVRTDIPIDLQLRLIAMLPELSAEGLSFTNIDDQLWPGYTNEGAWIYQGDWATLPGYVQDWLAGDLE